MSSNIVFMGTPDFAVPALRELHAAFGIHAVVTVPDKPKGRGLAMHQSAVKAAAIELGITNVLTPTSLKDPEFETQLRHIAPSIICVIAFRILPAAVYNVASLGAFNVHASLLPKYRGAAPINHAIINGEKETGVTSFLLNDVVDTGNILTQRTITIPPLCTAGDLYELLKVEAALCAVETCKDLLGGSAVPVIQTDHEASPAPKVFREKCKIDFSQPTATVVNFIHGMSPTPCAWTTWNDEVLKIFRCVPSNLDCEMNQVRIVDNALVIGCADGAIELVEIQFPGKQKVQARQFVNGYRGPKVSVLS